MTSQNCLGPSTDSLGRRYGPGPSDICVDRKTQLCPSIYLRSAVTTTDITGPRFCWSFDLLPLFIYAKLQRCSWYTNSLRAVLEPGFRVTGHGISDFCQVGSGHRSVWQTRRLIRFFKVIWTRFAAFVERIRHREICDIAVVLNQHFIFYLSILNKFTMLEIFVIFICSSLFTNEQQKECNIIYKTMQ